MPTYPGPGHSTLAPREADVRHCLYCAAPLPTIARNSKYCPQGECRDRAKRHWAENEKARKRRVKEKGGTR